MKIPEKGVSYKASPRAFLGNYIIGAGVLALALIVTRQFGIAFTFEPASVGELVNTLIYVGFGGVLVWLFGEFFFEGIIRRYIVSDSEVVKIEGILWKKRFAIPYQSVAEVKVSKGLLGRILNYGNVEVGGLKEGGVNMVHIGNPDEVRRIVEHKVNSMRSALSDRPRKRLLGKEDKEEDTEE